MFDHIKNTAYFIGSHPYENTTIANSATAELIELNLDSTPVESKIIASSEVGTGYNFGFSQTAYNSSKQVFYIGSRGFLMMIDEFSGDRVFIELQ